MNGRTQAHVPEELGFQAPLRSHSNPQLLCCGTGWYKPSLLEEMGEDVEMNALEIIELLDLKPHPEGGYFRESYRSHGVIPSDALPSEYEGQRNISTAIYYLLDKGARSKIHRVASDEMWHHYLGGPLKIVEIMPDGSATETIVGPEIEHGQVLQHVVPAGRWFGAYLPEGSDYALAGCTVAPGFDFADFELGKVEDLLRQFPGAEDAIRTLT